jgi:hypothetical protein
MCPDIAIIITAGTAIIAALIGNAVGAYFAYKNGMKLIQRTHDNATKLSKSIEFNKAAGQLRAAFAESLRELSAVQNRKHTGDIVSESLAKHEIAMYLFQPYIDESDRSGFYNAWEEYASKNSQVEYGWTSETTREKLANKLAQDRIHKLLSFAENK